MEAPFRLSVTAYAAFTLYGAGIIFGKSSRNVGHFQSYKSERCVDIHYIDELVVDELLNAEANQFTAIA